MKIDPEFDGHPEREFKDMTPEERLDDLSRKIALVLELRKLGAMMNQDSRELDQET